MLPMIMLATAIQVAVPEILPSIQPRALDEVCGKIEVMSCRMPGAISAEEARHRLTGKDEAFWVDDGVFHVVARRAVPAVNLCCDIQSGMEPVEGEPGLWRLSTWVQDIDRAVLDVIIIPSPQKATRLMSDIPSWRGPNAPGRMAVKPAPRAWVSEHTIQSQTLGRPRGITIYRPPVPGPLPVLYMADGESVTGYAETIQPLIENGSLPPVMLVGLHSGPQDAAPDDDLNMIRSREYLFGLDTGDGSLFDRHETFLLEEVLPLAESLGASTEPSQRIVAGYSNGAAWSLAMAGRNPERFGKVLALSFGWSAEPLRDLLTEGRFGDVYLNAGTLETSFHEDTAATARLMQTRAERVKFDSRVAGHSQTMWLEQFPLGLLWLMNPDGRRFAPIEVADDPVIPEKRVAAGS